jgi:hypothetical protein
VEVRKEGRKLGRKEGRKKEGRKQGRTDGRKAGKKSKREERNEKGRKGKTSRFKCEYGSACLLIFMCTVVCALAFLLYMQIKLLSFSQTFGSFALPSAGSRLLPIF